MVTMSEFVSNILIRKGMELQPSRGIIYYLTNRPNLHAMSNIHFQNGICTEINQNIFFFLKY